MPYIVHTPALQEKKTFLVIKGACYFQTANISNPRFWRPKEVDQLAQIGVSVCFFFFVFFWGGGVIWAMEQSSEQWGCKI